jgi:hypothetical protein
MQLNRNLERVVYLFAGIGLAWFVLKSCEAKPVPRVHTPSLASVKPIVDWHGKFTGKKEKYLNHLYNGKN